jgi:Type I phosphodiesterase / nucleotide pyrophosphatase
MSDTENTKIRKSPFIRFVFSMTLGIFLVCVGVIIGIFISPFFEPVSAFTNQHGLQKTVGKPEMEFSTTASDEVDPPLPEETKEKPGIITGSPFVPSASPTPTPTEVAGVPDERKPLPVSCHPEQVILISIDALRADSVTTHHVLPILGELAQDGAYDWQADTIFPSITNPGHASMLTGLNAEHHGVRSNAAEDYPYPYLQVKSIFNYLKDQDPSARNIAIVGKKRMVIFNQPDAVDQFYQFTKSQQVADAAIKATKRNKFKLLFIHLPDPDSAGHEYGFESEQYLNTVKRQDKILHQILNALTAKGIYSSSLIIIGSDHAGEGTGHGDYKDLDRWFPFVMAGPCVKNGFDIHDNSRQVSIMDFTPTILYSLGIPLPEGLDGTPLYEAFSSE